MKKYAVFAGSFIVVFSLFLGLLQIVSGLFLTSKYTPAIDEAWSTSANGTSQVVLEGSQFSFVPMVFLAFIAASVAYLIVMKVNNKTSRAQ